ncbi:HEXXH motif domain-containing protein [Streptomyces luteolifulvus]|uniref:HEXXH motif domain-containing protein n=1 Tax=Streptomyces luteolifulvus TaxID=2615112 RepID=A0A6H9V4P1_9ACTN|nr:HEXXH motif domain-containing protein [Streptomyces luteolifulvus]KAB1147326.1 HEXXH motif domain-containing protein [Streptomyces luteolifulvus]
MPSLFPTPRSHVLTPRSFDELLGGGGGPATVGALRASERSWRLLVVRALLDTAATAPVGPLPPPSDAWRLLTRAWEASRQAVEALLAYPAVGVWAAHTLRRLRGSAEDDAPLWADTGHLHALATAAAVRAGLEFRTDVPVRHGWAVLPSLGAMRVPEAGEWGVAEAAARAGGVRIAGRPLEGPDWHPLAELRADGCTLLLDPVDPYRALRKNLAAAPLDSSAGWQELFGEAWEILRGTDPEAARALADGLVALVPRPRSERFRPHSASSGDAFGAALTSFPDDGEQFASTLVHEFQHNKLSAFMHLFTLYDDRGTAGLHYAPWRDDPRPLGGLLQGVYAFFGVTAFWRRRPHPLGQFEFALWRSQTAYALRAIGRSDALTDLGRRLVAELSGRLEPWLAEPVDPRARSAADLAIADHRATWRAYHLRPGPEEVRARVETGPSPAEPALVPGTPERGFDTRAVLLRWLLADPAGFEALREDPGATVDGARPEDVDLVTGRTTPALAAFRARIARGDGDPETWVGLGLAARAEGDPAGEALLARPELAMAQYADAGGRPDPLELGRRLASRV